MAQAHQRGEPVVCHLDRIQHILNLTSNGEEHVTNPNESGVTFRLRVFKDMLAVKDNKYLLLQRYNIETLIVAYCEARRKLQNLLLVRKSCGVRNEMITLQSSQPSPNPVACRRCLTSQYLGSLCIEEMSVAYGLAGTRERARRRSRLRQ